MADPAVLADLGPFFAEYENAPLPKALARARELAAAIVETPDRTPAEFEASREAERELNVATEGLVKVFDVWCAEPFGVEKARGWLVTVADKLVEGEPAKGEAEHLEPAMRMAQDRSFFHWPAEFARSDEKTYASLALYG